MTRSFWQEPPTKPFRDWRTYMIGIPVLFSATGACIFMAFSFSFTEMGAIAQAARIRQVIIAAYATAIGSTFGSIGSGIEIYRKAFEKRAINLDWLSLGLSIGATLGGYMMGFAALIGTAQKWGDVRLGAALLVLSGLVALDAAGDLIELGGVFAGYNIRKTAWIEAREAHNEKYGIVERQDRIAIDPTWPEAEIGDARRVIARMNGERATLTRDGLEQALAREQLRLRKPSTTGRWLRMAHEGRE